MRSRVAVCRPYARAQARVIVVHDAATAPELCRRRLVPDRLHPGDETCPDVPYAFTWGHGGPSVDLDLNLVFVATSPRTQPAEPQPRPASAAPPRVHNLVHNPVPAPPACLVRLLRLPLRPRQFLLLLVIISRWRKVVQNIPYTIRL